jgi:hypothetical protein
MSAKVQVETLLRDSTRALARYGRRKIVDLLDDTTHPLIPWALFL